MTLESGGQVIKTLIQAVTRGGYSLQTVPKLLKEVIQNDMWRSFAVNSSDKVQSYEHFEEFVTAKVPFGLETNLDTLRALCWDEGRPDVANMIDQQIIRPAGQPEIKTENIEPEVKRSRGRPRKNSIVEDEKSESIVTNSDNKSDLSPRPRGDCRDAGLRRLREAPKKLRKEGKTEEAARIENLHKDVIDKKKTVHAAMKEAGFRKQTFTVTAENPERAAKSIFKHYGEDGVRFLIEELKKLLG